MKPLGYPTRAIDSTLHVQPRRCACENEHCQEPHRAGGCNNPGSVREIFGGKLCTACSQYMPTEFLEVTE